MKKALALLLAVMLMAGIFAGCSNDGGNDVTTEPSASTDPTSTPTYEGPIEDNGDETAEFDFPLVDDTLTFEYWVPNSASFEDFSSYNDNIFYQWMEEKTGVAMHFVHPAVGNETEAFQTMVLSNEYPDFVWGVSSYYSGGVDKAINDGFLMKLNDIVDQYMPNYKKVIYRDEDTFVRAISDSGNLWGLHHVVDYTQGAWLGLGIRQDWLDEAGLTVEDAATIDGMESVLTTFKSYTLDGQGPLFLATGGINTGGGIAGSYNVAPLAYGSNKILNVDGVATYSAMMPMFKDYAAKMADWYAKGLINHNFIADNASRPSEDRWVNSEIGLGEFVYTQAGLFAKTAAVSDLMPDPDFKLVAISTPALTEDMDISTDVHVRQTHDLIRANYSSGVTTQCDNIEIAAKYFDYIYSEEGTIAANWGPYEGEKGDINATYYLDPNDENGDGHLYSYQPWMLEKYGDVSNIQYKVASFMGSSLSIWSREWCVLTEEEINFTKTWDKAGCDWMWPQGVTLTSDEGEQASSILTNCNTAVSEWMAKVITGAQSVDTYDELVAELESNKLSEAVALYQTALDRYADRAGFMNE